MSAVHEFARQAARQLGQPGLGQPGSGQPGLGQPAKPPRPDRPLRLVPPRAFRPPRAPFVLLVVGLLAGGLLGLLLLNTVVAQNAFRVQDLQRTTAALTVREQALQQQVDTLDSPTTLGARARKLGMVPAGNPAFVRLSDGKVLGSPAPAVSPTPVIMPSVHPGTGTGASRSPATAARPPTGQPSPTPGPSTGSPGRAHR